MSGGTFSKSARPVRPGVYTDFESTAVSTVPPAAGSTVCIPLSHTWGPYKEFVTVTSFAEFQSLYGSDDTMGSRAVRMAFTGEGLPGRGGAGAVIVYRFGSTEAAKAKKILQNTAAEAAITLEGRYNGAFGNSFLVTTRDHAANAAQNELLIYNGSVLLETYVYTDANITNLGEQINANSKWVTATVTKTGVALSTVTSQAFASGNNGDAPKKADWATMLGKASTVRFGFFAPYAVMTTTTVGDGTSTEMQTTLATWITEMNSTGHRMLLVVGGELNEEMIVANERSARFNNPNVVNLGYGSYSDSNIINSTTGQPRVFATAELAPRLAGILASKGEAMSATFGRLQGLNLTNGPIESDILVGFTGGTTVLSADSNIDSPVRVEKSLTTYTTENNAAVPYVIYRNPKFVLTMQGIERELQEYGESTVIGQLPVNDKTRQLLVGEMKARLQARADRSIIQNAFTVEIDGNPPPTDNDEFIGLLYGIKFGRSIEQVYNTIRVG